jgi:orotidine-5'-phosphate decarboxylase
VAHARATGLIVIGDIKRADIGHSATRYADGHLGREDSADAVTVNAYFGIDGVRPFIAASGSGEHGVFVLVQTSNPSAATVQDVVMNGGGSFVEHVAAMVQSWAVDEAPVGESGYSCIGAVVSPRDTDSTRRIRALMPSCLFLVPGFGAQGRTADEVATCFRSDGTGALVTASRSIIYTQSRTPSRDWKAGVDEACRELVAQIRRVVHAG